MKKSEIWFAFAIIATFAGGGGAVAQEAGVDPNADCAAVLAAPPFVDMLTKNEGQDFRELSPQNSGRALLGLECSVDELTAFFENAGWEFLGYEEWSLSGPSGGKDGIPEFYNDSAARFCLKRPTLFGMFDFRCRPRASVYFHEGRIVTITTNMSK
jgi:hypothetical protein